MNNTYHIAILIVDLQNAYFNNDTLRDQQNALLKNTNEIITTAHRHHLSIFNIKTEHQKKHSNVDAKYA